MAAMGPASPELLAMLAQASLDHEAAFLAPRATVEIALVRAGNAAPRVGMSRLGGMPDAPPGLDWPCQRWPLAEVEVWPDFAREQVAAARARDQVRDEDGHLVMPLSFLAQIDLAEVRACDPEERLPERGLLLFFASMTTDIEERLFAKRVASAVRFVGAPAAELRPLPPPPMPDPAPTGVVALRAERRLHCELTWEEGEALRRKLPAAACEGLLRVTSGPADALFPAPMDECNGPMPPPGEIALLRVVEHDEIGIYIGDASWVTFAIPEGDLRARRFEGARAGVFIG
jgi:hypothetical protein